MLKYQDKLMPITVFLADDHTIVRDGLRSLLETQRDITVVGDAPDGRQALAQITELRPNIVVMDIAMQGLNGIEAARQTRQRCPQSQVIILSMHASEEYTYRALQAGVRGYLLKTAPGAEVIEAIRAVAAGRSYLSSHIQETLVVNYMHQHRADPLEALTAREREILQLVVEGKSSHEIALILSLSAKSVDTYRSRLMQKLGVKGLPNLIKFALEHGVV